MYQDFLNHYHSLVGDDKARSLLSGLMDVGLLRFSFRRQSGVSHCGS